MYRKVQFFFLVLYFVIIVVYIVWPPLSVAVGRGGVVKPPTKFSKKGSLDRLLNLRRGLLRKKG